MKPSLLPIRQIGLYFFLIMATVLSHSCTEDFDDNLSAGNNEEPEPEVTEVIPKDSFLFTQIVRVTTDSDEPTEEITCIDFIYPLQILVYDENLDAIGSQNITGDQEFSTFLGLIGDDYAISISYPIATTLEDGTVFSVNSNSELKIAIDNCSKEDIISY